MTVAELLGRISSYEITEWAAEYRLREQEEEQRENERSVKRKNDEGFAS